MLSEKNRIKLPLLDETGAAKMAVVKFATVLIVLLIFYNIPLESFAEKYPLCLFRIFFDRHCIGCGTTRAVWSVLHFNLIEAIGYNKLIIVSFPLLAGCTFSWIMNNPGRKQKSYISKIRQ